MIEGRAWVFGDAIDTDVLAPGHYMKLPLPELARHCLEAVDPRFAAEIRPGDILVAGSGFGIGSSREQAAEALRQLGVGAVLARSFARIFYRNALNLGLPVLRFDGQDGVMAGQCLMVDPVAGVVTNRDTGASFAVPPIPAHLMTMIGDGGLMPHLARRIGTGELDVRR